MRGDGGRFEPICDRYIVNDEIVIHAALVYCKVVASCDWTDGIDIDIAGVISIVGDEPAVFINVRYCTAFGGHHRRCRRGREKWVVEGFRPGVRNASVEIGASLGDIDVGVRTG